MLKSEKKIKLNKYLNVKQILWHYTFVPIVSWIYSQPPPLINLTPHFITASHQKRNSLNKYCSTRVPWTSHNFVKNPENLCKSRWASRRVDVRTSVTRKLWRVHKNKIHIHLIRYKPKALKHFHLFLYLFLYFYPKCSLTLRRDAETRSTKAGTEESWTELLLYLSLVPALKQNLYFSLIMTLR